ncbi:MAG: RluA family pseudouridine synthase [Faecalibacterium sp.]|nr:RluA family pseudouridine synthase [Ruminococcus sp.]MCM1391754.1 RluA family pseudouridine synthase [Ruminococcus sp.]MCM1485034.1 RluA family pseudouridine synthase [Faecalibacterium sp.]
MIDAYIFTVDEAHAGERIDKVICAFNDKFSRSAVQKIIETGSVSVGSVVATKNYKVKNGDKISVVLPQKRELEITAENIPLDIRYEDSDLLVVNKPKGMVVHPAAGNYDGTLVNALLYHCRDSLSGINGVIRPGIVHRIDKDTSGLLIVAKNDFAHIHLSEQIKAHSFAREYQTVVYGGFKVEEGTVDAPIGRHPVDRKRMTVTEKNSKYAVTHYHIIERFKDFTHLRVKLETGRTHQIRVHMAYIGHPVAGDPVYGPKKIITKLGGQCLHAGLIGFKHPRTGKYIEITSELPPYFTDFLGGLNSDR